MKYYLTAIIIFLISVPAFTQIKFDPGYLINEKDEKIECFIKNNDSRYNPTEFEYKIKETDSIHKGNLTDTKEFSVYNNFKYVRAHVKIDLSSCNINDLTTSGTPQWSDETVFLKALVEGKANLYSYEGKSVLRFFYSTDMGEIQQLIYKEYLWDGNNIGKNNGYQQQLWNAVKLKNNDLNSLSNMVCTKNQLQKYFVKYNQQNSALQKTETAAPKIIEKTKVNFLALRIKPGICNSTLKLSNVYGTLHINYKYTNCYCAGLDVEFTIPYWKNKWAVTVEPSFALISSKKQQYNYEVEHKIYTIGVNYQQINIPVGIRYYMFLNDKSILFLNGYMVADLFTKFSFSDNQVSDYKNLNYNFAIGGGYQYKNISAEIRYYTKKEIFNNDYWVADYNKVFFLIGYRFLDCKRKK
jgi:hypothetical protein